VIVGHAAADIRRQLAARQPRRVAVGDLVEPVRRLDLGEVFVAQAEHFRRVQLAQADALFPGEDLAHIGQPQLAARRLQTGRRRHARRDFDQDVVRQVGHAAQQHLHPLEPSHVGDLHRIGQQRRRAAGHDQPGEVLRDDERRIDVDVRVDEAGHGETPAAVEVLSGVVIRGIERHHPPVFDAQRGGLNPSRIDVDQLDVFDDEIQWLAAQGGFDETLAT